MSKRGWVIYNTKLDKFMERDTTPLDTDSLLQKCIWSDVLNKAYDWPNTNLLGKILMFRKTQNDIVYEFAGYRGWELKELGDIILVSASGCIEKKIVKDVNFDSTAPMGPFFIKYKQHAHE